MIIRNDHKLKNIAPPPVILYATVVMSQPRKKQMCGVNHLLNPQEIYFNELDDVYTYFRYTV
ncbi:hypothetical protein CHS0354_010961 [Potamilus streckersoni]|uniref:Uncharacterized protein n=1 Tax=Potamilus streckersoni TaxID=2493646 RepID=A0AAE0SSN9_9BIVA|nr:hypothetical protein CHS0354_010961 [Potamilus streckersoni]